MQSSQKKFAHHSLLSKVSIFLVTLTFALLLSASISLADQDVIPEPGENDINKEEAISLAKDILIQNYDGIEHHINSSDADATFVYPKTEYSAPVWSIEFSSADSYYGVYSGKYYVNISGTGEILSYQAPYSLPYAPNENEMSNVRIVEPSNNDISESEAISKAKIYINEIGDFESMMDQLTTKAFFLYGDRYNKGKEPVWIIYFYQDDVMLQKMLLGYDGSYIDTTSANTQFEAANRSDDFLSEVFDYHLRFMSISEKAEFSKKWVPIVEEYVQTHPYYASQNALFYQATRQVFGLPSEGDISPEEAVAIGVQAVTDLGMPVDDLEINPSYDITNPNQPVWAMIVISKPGEGNANLFLVKMDAKTGTVVSCKQISHDAPENFFY